MIAEIAYKLSINALLTKPCARKLISENPNAAFF
jgi:hypothetical protein